MSRLPRSAWPVLILALLVGSPARAEEAPQADLTSPEAVRKALGDRDPAVRLAAARAAKEIQDPKLTAPLVSLLKDKDLPLREAAVQALVARADEKERRSAARALAALLPPLDREPTAEDLALEKLLVPALHDLAQKETVKALLDDIHMEAPAEWIRARLRAVANVPAPEAIEALIDYGSRRRAGDGHRVAVREALKYATDVDFSGDPDRWREWWREAKDGFDFEAAAARRAKARQTSEEKEERRAERARQREEKGGEKEREKEGGEEEGGAGGGI